MTRTMLCSCATGAPVAQTNVTGARLSDLLSLAQIEEDANTITFRAADHTLEEKEITAVMDKILTALTELGIELRK